MGQAEAGNRAPAEGDATRSESRASSVVELAEALLESNNAKAALQTLDEAPVIQRNTLPFDERLEFLLHPTESLHKTAAEVTAFLQVLEASVKSLERTMSKHDEAFLEFQEDRRQINRTLQTLIESQERDRKEWLERDCKADERMARLERLFEQSIKRGPNGKHT